jgi:hypothetical protein
MPGNISQNDAMARNPQHNARHVRLHSLTLFPSPFQGIQAFSTLASSRPGDALIGAKTDPCGHFLDNLLGERHNMKKIAVFGPLLLAAMIPLGAQADLPGKHPYYLHALTDLREARWMLEHRPGDAAVSGEEDVAITRIDETINEIKKAAIDDGKDIHDHPPGDAHLDHPGRLHHADEILHKVHSDIAREEDDPMTRGLRDRAIHHLDEAIHATQKAIHDVEMHH